MKYFYKVSFSIFFWLSLTNICFTNNTSANNEQGHNLNDTKRNILWDHNNCSVYPLQDACQKLGAFDVTKKEQVEGDGYSYKSQSDDDRIEEITKIARFPSSVSTAINNCETNNINSDFCNCLVEKADNPQVELASANSWLDDCNQTQIVENTLNPQEIATEGTTTPEKPAAEEPAEEEPAAEEPAEEEPAAEEPAEEEPAAEEPAEEEPRGRRGVASSVNIGDLSCDRPTLNNYCSMSSQDSPIVIPGEEALKQASEDAASIVNDLVGADPYDNAQFNCGDSLEHEKSGAEFVCENPVKALGGPAAQAVRAIGQYGAPIVGASGLLMKNNESINKLCTTIAMLSATGVGIGVAARRKCSGKIKKCQQTCETEKTQICTAYQTQRAKCVSVQAKVYAVPAFAPALQKLQQRIKNYQQKVEEIESVKRRCKKLEANIASMGQDILNLVMTLGSAKACRDATGGKYTSDIENCEERGGEVVPDPLGNLICNEPEQKCTTTSECPDNEMCMNGICRAITGICRDGSLKACSETCEDGEPPSNCPTKQNVCPDPSLTYPDCNCDCPPNQSCNSQRQCVRPDVCPDPSMTYPNCDCNCPTGQPCNSQRQCVRPDVCPDPSMTYPNCDCDCPTGQPCNSQRQCVRPDVCPDPSMTYPNCNCDCPPNQTCNSQKQCVRPDVCPNPSLTYPNCNCDCPTGQSCNSDQQCVRPVCADGSNNYPNCGCNNCPTGQSCNSDQQCVRPVCADGSNNYPNCGCNNCPTGQSCNSDQQCVPDNNNDGKGDCSDGSRVACDQDCPNGSRPTNCRSCNSNNDCEENQICNRGVCISEDPVLSQDGAGGGGAPIDDMESEMAITNDGMGGGDGNQRKPSGNPLSGMGLPNAEEFERSGGTAGGTDSASGATDSSASGGGGGGGFFSGLFGGGRKGKSKGKGIMHEDEGGATMKGAGGGGFGGYGGGGRKGRGKLALSKKQIKKLKKEKGAQRTLSKMKEGFGGAHHDIFERITKRFTHLCKNKMNCR